MKPIWLLLKFTTYYQLEHEKNLFTMLFLLQDCNWELVAAGTKADETVQTNK